MSLERQGCYFPLGRLKAAGFIYGELFHFAYPERFDLKTASPAARTIVSMLEGLHPSQSRLGPPPSEGPPVPRKKEKGKAEKEAAPADLEEVVRRVMQEIQRQGEGRKAGNGSEEP